MSSIKTALRSATKKGMPLVLASSMASQFGCAGFPKPSPDEMPVRSIELSASEAIDKSQWDMIRDVLEGKVRTRPPFKLEKISGHSTLTITGERTGDHEWMAGEISSWKGEELSWILPPYSESIRFSLLFANPNEITYKNAYDLGTEMNHRLIPSISVRYGGWNDTCEDVMPVPSKITKKIVRGLEFICHLKIPKNEGKRTR